MLLDNERTGRFFLWFFFIIILLVQQDAPPPLHREGVGPRFRFGSGGRISILLIEPPASRQKRVSGSRTCYMTFATAPIDTATFVG